MLMKADSVKEFICQLFLVIKMVTFEILYGPSIILLKGRLF